MQYLSAAKNPKNKQKKSNVKLLFFCMKLNKQDLLNPKDTSLLFCDIIVQEIPL